DLEPRDVESLESLAVAPENSPARHRVDCAVAPLSERDDRVRAKAHALVGPERAPAIANDPAVLRADPERAFGVLGERRHPRDLEPGTVRRVEDGEAQAVVAQEAVEGREPQEAVAGLQDRVEGILGEPRVGAESGEALRRGALERGTALGLGSGQ